jgi:hypothetical protein
MIESASTKTLDAALLKAMLEMGNPEKNAKNPHFKNSYANLESVLGVCREPLLKAGIVLVQGYYHDETGWNVCTRLKHAETGEFRDTLFPVTPATPNPQGFASGQTYGRRYGLMAALGLVGEDDDGNASSVRAPQQQATRPQQPTAPRTAPAQNPTTTGTTGQKVTAPQVKRLWAIAMKSGWDADTLHDYVKHAAGAASLNDIPWREYETICKYVEGNRPHARVQEEPPPPGDADAHFPFD